MNDLSHVVLHVDDLREQSKLMQSLNQCVGVQRFLQNQRRVQNATQQVKVASLQYRHNDHDHNCVTEISQVLNVTSLTSHLSALPSNLIS